MNKFKKKLQEIFKNFFYFIFKIIYGKINNINNKNNNMNSNSSSNNNSNNNICIYIYVYIYIYRYTNVLKLLSFGKHPL